MTIVAPDFVSLSVSLPDAYFTPIPLRQRIIDKLTRRMERITIANGYQTDAGLSVVYGQLTEPNPAPIGPSIYLWDGDESSEKEYGDDIISLDVTVSLFELISDEVTPLERFGNRLLADCKRAMMLNSSGIVDLEVDGLADNLTYVSGTIEPGIRHAKWIQALTQWTVVYLTPIGDPYTIKSQQ